MFMTINRIFKKDGKIYVDLFERKSKNPKIVTVDGDCLASYGTASNSINQYRQLYKAGQARRLNRRPKGVIGLKRHFKRRTKRLNPRQMYWAKVRRMYYARKFFLPHLI